jgi:DNA-binding NtrC family response regulator
MKATAMQRVARLSDRAARSPLPILLEGEAGVGKATLARAIHAAAGPQRSRPFVAVDCGDGTASLRAAFADASGGTLFLRNIELLPTAGQAEVAERLGEAERPAFRLVAASPGRLVDRVAAGAFRDDLFHRLNVLTIWLPPLRERRLDIPAIAASMLARTAGPGLAIGRDAIALLCAHDWPGNLGELENALRRAVALCEGESLAARHFAGLSRGGDAPPAGVAVARQRQDGTIHSAGSTPDTVRAARYGLARLLDERGELRAFDVLEEEVIRFAVAHCGGRMSEVARRLRIGRSTLYRKLKDYGIEPERSAAPPLTAPPEPATGRGWG